MLPPSPRWSTGRPTSSKGEQGLRRGRLAAGFDHGRFGVEGRGGQRAYESSTERSRGSNEESLGPDGDQMPVVGPVGDDLTRQHVSGGLAPRALAESRRHATPSASADARRCE